MTTEPDYWEWIPVHDCPKCHGDGWLRGNELDEPSDETYADTMTRYTCDHEAHRTAFNTSPVHD